jgi:hypothetical protein
VRRPAAFAFVLLAAPFAVAKPQARPAPLTPDQQTVVAAIVHETFPKPRPGNTPLALCLDVQVTDAEPDETPGEEFPQPRARGHVRRGGKPARATKRPTKQSTKRSTPPPDPVPTTRGAPPELVEQVNRPWRAVVSATACHLDPLQPYTLNDAGHTPAQLVTVRLAPGPAPTTARIDWTASASAASRSRDCTTAHDAHGWTVHCGGTWSQ